MGWFRRKEPESMVPPAPTSDINWQEQWGIQRVFLQRALQLLDDAAEALRFVDDPATRMAARYLQSEARGLRLRSGAEQTPEERGEREESK